MNCGVKLHVRNFLFTQETAAPMEESTSDDTTLEQVQLEADDDRNSVNLIRDEDGKIKFYEI